MKCPECRSENVRFSENGFPVFNMDGKVWYCSNCRLVWNDVNMSVMDQLDDWILEWILDRYWKDGEIQTPFLISVMLKIWDIIMTIRYRIFIRGKCALFGCEECYAGSSLLPDDVLEWWCDRCGAEGINHVVYSRRLFYGDNKLRDFLDALRGK